MGSVSRDTKERSDGVPKRIRVRGTTTNAHSRGEDTKKSLKTQPLRVKLKVLPEKIEKIKDLIQKSENDKDAIIEETDRLRDNIVHLKKELERESSGSREEKRETEELEKRSEVEKGKVAEHYRTIDSIGKSISIIKSGLESIENEMIERKMNIGKQTSICADLQGVLDDLKSRLETERKHLQEVRKEESCDDALLDDLHSKVIEMRNSFSTFCVVQDIDDQPGIFFRENAFEDQKLFVQGNRGEFDFDRIFNNSVRSKSIEDSFSPFALRTIQGNDVLFVSMHSKGYDGESKFLDLTDKGEPLMLSLIRILKQLAEEESKSNWSHSLMLQCVKVKNHSFFDLVSSEVVSDLGSAKAFTIESDGDIPKISDFLDRESPSEFICKLEYSARNQSEKIVKKGSLCFCILNSNSEETSFSSSMTSVFSELKNNNKPAKLKQDNLSWLEGYLKVDAFALILFHISSDEAVSEDTIDILKFAASLSLVSFP